MFNPVQPGEPMRRNMTAEWFNQTLPKTQVGRLNQQPQHTLPPGTLECVLDGGTPERFKPVALNSVVSNNDIEMIPRVSISNLNEFNWGVAQTATTGTIQVCFHGLCWAEVATKVGVGERVTWSDPTAPGGDPASPLMRSTRGKAQLLWYSGADFTPSLICIGEPISVLYGFLYESRINATRFVGNLRHLTAGEGATGDGNVEIHDPNEIYAEYGGSTFGYCMYQPGSDFVAVPSNVTITGVDVDAVNKTLRRSYAPEAGSWEVYHTGTGTGSNIKFE